MDFDYIYAVTVTVSSPVSLTATGILQFFLGTPAGRLNCVLRCAGQGPARNPHQLLRHVQGGMLERGEGFKGGGGSTDGEGRREVGEEGRRAVGAAEECANR